MEAEGSAQREERETSWLVLRAQAGDREALEALLERAHRSIGRYVTMMVRDADLAEDVLQETLLIVYRKLGSLREPRAFPAWLRRIAAREVFRALQRRRAAERMHEELDEEHHSAYGDDGPEVSDLLDRLPGLLGRVSPASRAVLTLHYIERLTLDDIAVALELPMGTVKSRLAYGLAMLRRQMA
jgi:RNA polymerase sigma-70 factor, ECF subfamily